MKTTLTAEQSATLIELGVKASTLIDLLTILPKWIKYRNMLLWLDIHIDEWEERWCCVYKSSYDCDEADTYQSAPELIDALYELLVCCIKDKLITPTQP